MDRSDEELLSLLTTDLDHHFRRLVEIYQQRLYLFALRLTGRLADAEDIVQEMFLLYAIISVKVGNILKQRSVSWHKEIKNLRN